MEEIQMAELREKIKEIELPVEIVEDMNFDYWVIDPSHRINRFRFYYLPPALEDWIKLTKGYDYKIPAKLVIQEWTVEGQDNITKLRLLLKFGTDLVELGNNYVEIKDSDWIKFWELVENG